MVGNVNVCPHMNGKRHRRSEDRPRLTPTADAQGRRPRQTAHAEDPRQTPTAAAHAEDPRGGRLGSKGAESDTQFNNVDASQNHSAEQRSETPTARRGGSWMGKRTQSPGWRAERGDVCRRGTRGAFWGEEPGPVSTVGYVGNARLLQCLPQ